jgi:hypothetical protein
MVPFLFSFLAFLIHLATWSDQIVPSLLFSLSYASILMTKILGGGAMGNWRSCG